MAGEHLPVPACAGRHHAIEHVDPAAHRLDDIVRRADAHEIARLRLRQVRFDRFDHAQHDILRFADRQPADRVALQVERRERRRALDPKRLDRAALHDAEHRLAGLFAERDPAAFGPAQGQAHGLLGHFVRAWQLHAFVELHLDVGAEQALDLDRALRRHHVGRAVDMRLEGHAGLVDLPQGCQRHHLEAAGIRQDRIGPVHELVQAAELRHPLRARAAA